MLKTEERISIIFAISLLVVLTLVSGLITQRMIGKPLGEISRFLPGRTFVPLGTDGMGRSDTREALRDYFEVDTGHVVVAVLSALVAEGKASADEVQAAIARHNLNADAADPLDV